MKVWIHIDGVQEGPFELDRLPLQRIRPDTPVWHEGLDYWKEACQVPEVAQMLANRPAPAQEPVPEPVTDRAAQPGPAVSEPAEEPVVSEPVVSEPVESPVVSEPVVVPVKSEPEVTVEPEAGDAEDVSCVSEEFPSEPEPARQPYSHPQQPYSHPQQPYYGRYDNGMPVAAPADSGEEGKPAPTYILWAVLVTLLCCCPVGVAAIVTSLVTSRRNSNYDYAGARRMSEATAWLIIISLVLALISAPFSFLVML